MSLGTLLRDGQLFATPWVSSSLYSLLVSDFGSQRSTCYLTEHSREQHAWSFYFFWFLEERWNRGRQRDTKAKNMTGSKRSTFLSSHRRLVWWEWIFKQSGYCVFGYTVSPPCIFSQCLEHIGNMNWIEMDSPFVSSNDLSMFISFWGLNKKNFMFSQEPEEMKMKGLRKKERKKRKKETENARGLKAQHWHQGHKKDSVF